MRGAGHHPAPDESGQLSIDFYIGLSIFLITLIIASTMISGLLVGLQSKKIDYDAVAYRSGVILVEDPGEPNTVFNYLTINDSEEWEFIGIDQKRMVRRFGLSLYKSTPRTLSEQKIISFTNQTRFPALSEYRERIIFGSYPYHFNITLKVTGDPPIYYPPVGLPYDPNSTYGYIRRVVLVKNQSRAEVNMTPFFNNTTPNTGKFWVELNYNSLMDPTRAPHYWIEPPKEDITINLYNISQIRNQSQPNRVHLTNITIEYYGRLWDQTETWGELPIDVTALVDNTSPPVTFVWPSGPGDDCDVNSTINITFPAGYFIPPSAYANITLIRMNVTYYFDPATVNISTGNDHYDYLKETGLSPPSLNPAIVEVRVW